MFNRLVSILLFNILKSFRCLYILNKIQTERQEILILMQHLNVVYIHF
jgi:hypothetical protein